MLPILFCAVSTGKFLFPPKGRVFESSQVESSRPVSCRAVPCGSVRFGCFQLVYFYAVTFEYKHSTQQICCHMWILYSYVLRIRIRNGRRAIPSDSHASILLLIACAIGSSKSEACILYYTCTRKVCIQHCRSLLYCTLCTKI